MEPTTLELAMKAMTFLGVALAAALVAARHATLGALARDALLGAGGIALMLANARLGASALGLVVDAAYLGACALLLVRHARAASRRSARGGAAGTQPAAR